jgi:hypothetical protein
LFSFFLDNILTKEPIATGDQRNGQEKDTRAGLETHLRLEPVVHFFTLIKKNCTNAQSITALVLVHDDDDKGTRIETLFSLEP